METREKIDRVVDARGLPCPKPLILVRKALSEMVPGQTLQVLLDNETSCNNVFRFMSDNGCEPARSSVDGQFSVIGRKTSATATSLPTGEYCTPSPGVSGPVICFNRRGMGQGSDELGNILVQGFVNALREISPLPPSIVFYNAGVQLACEGSPILPALKELEKKGVRLLVCGTCLEFFDLRKKLGAGTVSNMLEILQVLHCAHHIVNP